MTDRTGRVRCRRRLGGLLNFYDSMSGQRDRRVGRELEHYGDGPTSLDAAKRNEMIEHWITRRVDAIAVAVKNRAGISTVLRLVSAALRCSRGTPTQTQTPEFFVNQATAEGIGNTLTDEAARLPGGLGSFAIITGALTAANQNEWIGSGVLRRWGGERQAGGHEEGERNADSKGVSDEGASRA